jgi:hypothetical protein
VNYSRTVLWLGLILIVLNLVKDWSVVKSTIFTKSSTSTATAQPSTYSPIDSFLQGIGSGLVSEPTVTTPSVVAV